MTLTPAQNQPDPWGVAVWELYETEKAAKRAPAPDGFPSASPDVFEDVVTITDPAKFVEGRLARIEARLGEAVQGTRNATLNNEALGLGHLVGGGLLEHDAAAEWLEGVAVGLWDDIDLHNERRTIDRALRDGAGNPIAWVQGERQQADPGNPFGVALASPPPVVEVDPATGELIVNRTTWWPRDLGAVIRGEVDAEPAPSFLERSDGRALFYAGKVNGLIGESESGKTWVALISVAQALNSGQAVLYLDFEDTARGIVGRLRALGVGDAHLALLTYISPDENLHGPAERDLREALDATTPALVILDGYNAAMTLLGLDLSNNSEVTAFSMRVLRPMARRGACVVTIDHVTKSKDGRGTYAIGAQAKRADVDGCLIIVEVGQPFGRGQVGRLKLTVSKDRPGHVRAISAGAKNAGEAILRSSSDSGAVDANVAGPDLRPREERGPFRPTVLMQRVSEFLEAIADPVSRNSVKTTVVGNNEAVLQALDVLVAERYAKMEGTRYVSTRPYREASEMPGHAVPGTSLVVPEGQAVPRVPTSPLPLGGREGRVTEASDGFPVGEAA